MNHEQLINKYLYFNGKYYDVGTKVKIKTRWCGVQEATFCGWMTKYHFVGKEISGYFPREDSDKYIVEIIEPVEVIFQQSNGRACPDDWHVETAWGWYIVIMAVGIIFKARLMIWIVASLIFFLWKNGFCNGGKK